MDIKRGPAVSLLLIFLLAGCLGSEEGYRLHDDLISKSGYNKLIRPIGINTHKLILKIGLKLVQINDVDTKNQILSTSVWVVHQWCDTMLAWDPGNYGNITTIYLPSDSIWLPDLVLYNNADGDYQITQKKKAKIKYTGHVTWDPPAIYKSLCQINVQYFPYDEQHCKLKFGTWTYDGTDVILNHINQTNNEDYETMDNGIDMRDFSESVEWDVLSVQAQKTIFHYTCCPEPYLDITFHILLRRKTLFYSVNLIFPCVIISFLTVLVFYLPSDSGEKISLSISILLSLTVFILLLADIIPPTSLVVPLIGKYLLFTLILVTLSTISTVIVLNVHYRSSSTHSMSPWVKRVFLEVLPRLLRMQRPQSDDTSPPPTPETPARGLSSSMEDSTTPLLAESEDHEVGANLPSDVRSAVDSITFIVEHLKSDDEDSGIEEDWKFVAMVLDRFFLYIFTIACLVGTFGIIMQAPSLYDDRVPIIGFSEGAADDSAGDYVSTDNMCPRA